MAFGFINTNGSAGTTKIEIKYTLMADEWTEDGTYTVDLRGEGLSGDETFLVCVSMDATEDERFDFSYAEIYPKSQDASGFVLQCMTLPIENIPLDITILK